MHVLDVCMFSEDAYSAMLLGGHRAAGDTELLQLLSGCMIQQLSTVLAFG